MQTLRWLESDFLSLTDIKCDTGTSNPGDIDMCIVSKGANDPGNQSFRNFLFLLYENSLLPHTPYLNTSLPHKSNSFQAPVSRSSLGLKSILKMPGLELGTSRLSMLSECAYHLR